MTLLAFTIMAFSSMFVIVDPIASIPAFLAMTARDTQEQRIKMARLACLVAAGVLLTFAMIGEWIFKYLGITLPAFQMAASLVPNWSLHALRHSWATSALQRGADPLTVAILMGHSDPSMLSKVYQHVAMYPLHMLQQANKTAELPDRSGMSDRR